MRFQVYINDIQQFIAGAGQFGVLSAILHRVKRNPEKTTPEGDSKISSEEFYREKIEFEVGGLDSNTDKEDFDRSFRYLSQELKIGDEIRIKILAPGKYDEPKYK